MEVNEAEIDYTRVNIELRERMKFKHWMDGDGIYRQKLGIILADGLPLFTLALRVWMGRYA
jgi:hypothetical protein